MAPSICNRAYVAAGPKSSSLDINPIDLKFVRFVLITQIAISWSPLSTSGKYEEIYFE